jgi:hypoxanthine phosphoribosyltransferase
MTASHGDTGGEGKEVLTWEAFGLASRELAQQIADSGFRPEVILAVARGGMIPTGALSYALGLKLNDCINVEFYTDVAKTLPDPILLAPMLDTDSIRDKRILVVDDVVDSGRTLALVLKLLHRFGADVRSAVLYEKPTTVVRPNYVWAKTAKWIVFPWSALPPVTPGASGGRAV